jgi:hypothetical protein
MAGDLRFFEFVVNAIESPKAAGSLYYGPMPDEPPSFESSNIVLYAGCGQTFEPGFFHLNDMNVRGRQHRKIAGFKPIPDDDETLRETIREADLVIYGPKCKQDLPRPGTSFTMAATRKGEQIWVRKRRRKTS